MGRDLLNPDEQPVHRARSMAYMAEHPVTVNEVRRFAKATGYVRAEGPLDSPMCPGAGQTPALRYSCSGAVMFIRRAGAGRSASAVRSCAR